MNKIMTKKVFHGVHATLLLIAAMFFTACAEDVVVEKANQKTDADYEGLTCFAAEAPEGTRTSMYRNGRFAWVNRGDSVDHVWVVKDGTPVLSKLMTITSDSSTLAKFYLEGDYTENQYPVLYAGTVVGETMPTAVPNVTIPAQQVQRTANNSEHFGVSGDCGTATAKKTGGKYSFTLGHEMAYLMFEPRMDTEGNTLSTVIRSITVTEITEPTPKDIRGVFTLDGTGATMVAGSGSNQIKVICGEDVLPVEAGTMKHSQAKNYGFAINNTDYTPYGKIKDADGVDVEETANGRVYMVIKPTVTGEPYKLKVEYEVATKAQQIADHEHTKEQWDMGYEYTWDVLEKEVEFTPKKGEFYRIRHKLLINVLDPDFTYSFNQYYMWGAQEWFWKKAETLGKPYPVMNDGHQTDYAPDPSNNSDSWFNKDYASEKVCVGTFNTSGYNYYVQRTSSGANIKANFKTGMRHKQASGTNWDNALTANEMSFYVVYGDPYYDSETEWVLEGYNGVRTVCKGGVWIKKKEVIRKELASRNAGLSSYQQIWWPSNDDASNYVYSAPFPGDKVKETLPTTDTYNRNFCDQLNGQQFNLRYMAPPVNFRMPYTNWDAAANDWMEGVHRPSQDTRFHKSDDDYFFVPCLGRFEYDNTKGGAVENASFTYPVIMDDEDSSVGSKTANFSLVEGTGEPTLTLVGAQGFYWTKTPLQHQVGGSTYFHKYVYDGGGTLQSEYSNFDYYETLLSKYNRWHDLYELMNAGTITAEENAEYLALDPHIIKESSKLTNNLLKGIFRYKTYGHYNDNAFYLNLHYHYIALSWQQHSMYVKTGMHIARTSGAAKQVIFE